jgi:hypothetical protein
MFGKHFKRELSAYAHGELSREEAGRVARHLEACAACRQESDEINLGIRLAEQMQPAAAPDSIWQGIESVLEREAAARARRPSARRFSFFPAGRRLAFASLAVVVLLLGASALVLYRRATRPAWEVTSLGGTLLIDAARVTKAGRLAVGAWLETDENSRARLQVANIGTVEVEPETRLRLVETGLTEHRLELQRGRISARISAPPRFFYVDTPSAVAEDLGCAYTLEVDDEGRSLLRVNAGWVALALNGRESVVPAGAACATRPGTGPGTPYFEDAGQDFVDALSRLDFEQGGDAALDAVLAAARTRDTLTLWHLLPRVPGDARARVYDKLTSLSPPPDGVTREAVLALEPHALAAWKERLETIWTNESMPRRKWREFWTSKE